MNHPAAIWIPVICFLSVSGCSRTTGPSSSPEETGTATLQTSVPAEIPAAEISPENLARDIMTLSSDSFGGRAPATAGGKKTRAFLVAEMEKAGLEPFFDGSFEQPVPLVEITPDRKGSYLEIGGKTLQYGSEAVFWTTDPEGSAVFDDSPLVFAGYGIVAPEYDRDDYRGMDVTGKTVVILVNDPGFATGDTNLFNGRAMTYYGRWTYKLEEAARQGATAALIIHQEKPASYGWDVVAQSWSGPLLHAGNDNGPRTQSIPELAGWIEEETARALFAGAGLDFEKMLEAAAGQDFMPVTINDLTASAKVSGTVRHLSSANVAGVIPGASRADEYIVYMAHWDHLGTTAPASGESADADRIFNGAIDNASGTAGILELARSFSENSTVPERSVLFLAVTAEESGLVGSAYFAEHAPVSPEKIVAGINIDGFVPLPPTRDLSVIGYGSSGLEDILAEAVQKRDMYLTPDANPGAGYFFRSDHISLAKKGIPVLFVSNGTDLVASSPVSGTDLLAAYEKRYHTPADAYSADWNLDGTVRFLEILYEVGATVAYSAIWPQWYESSEFHTLRKPRDDDGPG